MKKGIIKKIAASITAVNLLLSSLPGIGTAYSERKPDEVPTSGPFPQYTDMNDEKGVYPVHNDGNVQEDITVVNPETGVTSPSIMNDPLSEDISKSRTLEYENAWLTKYIKEIDRQGKSEINLRVEGKEFSRKLDIVLVIDNSNSMGFSDGFDKTRMQATKEAATDFVEAFKGNDRVGISLVTYGTDIMDGRLGYDAISEMESSPEISDKYGEDADGEDIKGEEYLKRIKNITVGHDIIYPFRRGLNFSSPNHEEKAAWNEYLENGQPDMPDVPLFSKRDSEKDHIIDTIPSAVPSDTEGYSYLGGTFTQKALREAQNIITLEEKREILNGEEKSEKVIVLLTDGAPTYSYKVKSVEEGNGRIKVYDEMNDEYSEFYGENVYEGKVASEFIMPNEDNSNDFMAGNGNNMHLGEKLTGAEVQKKFIPSIGNTGMSFSNPYYEPDNPDSSEKPYITYMYNDSPQETELENYQKIYGIFSYPSEEFIEENLGGAVPENPLDFYIGDTRYTYLLDKEYITEDGFTVKDTAFATISEALHIRESETDIYTIGVGLKTGPLTELDYASSYEKYKMKAEVKTDEVWDYSTKEELNNIMMNISGSEKRYLDAEGAGNIAEKFNEISKEIKKSIPNGKVEDPMGEYFNLDLMDLDNPQDIKVKYPWTDSASPEYTEYDIEITMDSASVEMENELYIKNYETFLHTFENKGLSQEEAEQLALEEAEERRLRVIYNHDLEKLEIENINLFGEGNWLNMRYRVQADTEIQDENGNEIFIPGVLYPANGKTTLIPNIYSEHKEVLNFYVPSARVDSVDIEVVKKWFGFSEEEKFNVEFDIIRNGEVLNKQESPYIISRNPENQEWSLKVQNLIKFDSRGNDYEFGVSERRNSDLNYSIEVKDETDPLQESKLKKFSIENTLVIMPNTGGNGTSNFKTAGMSFLIGAFAVYLKRFTNK